MKAQAMTFSAIDHPSFKLNEQQEAVLDYMAGNRGGEDWWTAYQLIGKRDSRGVTIGDAGRRMRELREAGILESRKRGRFEEYRLAQGCTEPASSSRDADALSMAKFGPEKVRTVHSREEAYDLEDRGWKIVSKENVNGLFKATLTKSPNA